MLRPGKMAETVEAEIKLPAETCSRILLFVRSPYQKPIKKVTVDGKEWKEWDAVKESIVIPQTTKNIKVLVYY